MSATQTLSRNRTSLATVACHILDDGEESWKGWLFEFVDDFRKEASRAMLADAPPTVLTDRLRCLLASTVEALCVEQGWQPPVWCAAVGPLATPWFVSGVENLKASALVESPLAFRKRNLFVLGNFLDRA
jgi:hypothetical protein